MISALTNFMITFRRVRRANTHSTPKCFSVRYLDPKALLSLDGVSLDSFQVADPLRSIPQRKTQTRRPSR